MSFIHRSIKYLYRKKGRSLLLLMLMMAISLGILGSVSIQKATDISRQEMRKSLNTHFTLLPNPGVFWGVGPRGFGDIFASMIENIAKTEGIHDYQMTLIGEARLPGMKKKDVENPRVQYNAEQERLLKEHFDFEGNRNTELDHKFISGVLTLKEGRHLQAKDQGKALVHEDFAKSNGLSLHDTFTYRSSPVNEFTEKGDDTLEIVGIFSGSNQAQASHREELFENMILTDLKTAQSLRAYNEDNALYDQAHFFVEDPDNLESILNKVKNLAFPWERYQVSQAEQNYAGMLTSLSSMDQIVRQMFIGILIISVFVLSLILWFWMQGRIQETGILLSLGFSKVNILAQYLSEVAIVFSFALMLSLPMSHQISEKLSQTVVKQAQAKTEAAQNQELGGLSMGSDANSSVASQTLEHLDVHIQKEDFIKVIAMGHVIILLSVGSASGYLLRMKPKEILSKMS